MDPYRPPRGPLESGSSDVLDRPAGVDWRLIAAIGCISCLIGFGSRHVRPMITGPIHYEAIVAICLQTVLGIVVLARVPRRLLRDAMINVNLAMAAIWGGYFVGWTIYHGQIWNDFVGVTVGFWCLFAAVGSLWVYVLHRFSTRTVDPPETSK